MAKLRHIAFIVKEPKKLYDFYHHAFGLEQVRVSPSGSIHVIDGLFNLAFLQQKLDHSEVVNTHRADGSEIDQNQGINHFGFLVGSLDQALSRLPESVTRGESPQNGRPAEMRVIDPWGNKFDISSKGFLGREEKRLPGVRLVVIQTASPDQAARFYESVLEIRKTRTLPDGTVMLSDGDVSLALTPAQTIGKPGIQYFGIQVKDWSSTRKSLKEMGIDLSGQRATDGVFRLRDPEGNLFLVSEQGW
jgi:catechol 2,3-dioxygenase-like lactoylglutathione lyase family enzyme